MDKCILFFSLRDGLFFSHVLKVRYLAVPGRLVVFCGVRIEALFSNLCREKSAKRQWDCAAGKGKGEGIAERAFAPKMKESCLSITI